MHRKYLRGLHERREQHAKIERSIHESWVGSASAGTITSPKDEPITNWQRIENPAQMFITGETVGWVNAALQYARERPVLSHNHANDFRNVLIAVRAELVEHLGARMERGDDWAAPLIHMIEGTASDLDLLVPGNRIRRQAA